MESKTSKSCLYSWFSGFFAAPAIAHGLRLIFGWQLSAFGVNFTWAYSLIIFIICGAISLGLLFRCCRSCS